MEECLPNDRGAKNDTRDGALSDTLALQLLKQMVNAGDILRFGLLLSIVMLSVGPHDLVVPEMRESSHTPWPQDMSDW